MRKILFVIFLLSFTEVKAQGFIPRRSINNFPFQQGSYNMGMPMNVGIGMQQQQQVLPAYVGLYHLENIIMFSIQDNFVYSPPKKKRR